MRTNFLLFCFCLSSFLLSAQISGVDPVAAQFYFYPQFAAGKVHFKDGQKSETKLNYNLALEEIHFINKHGDTLALSNEETLQVVVIGNDSFYFEKGFLKVVESYSSCKLVAKQKNAAEKKQRGAYGEDLSGASTLNINNIVPTSRASVKLGSNEGSYGNFEVSYYIMDANNTFIPISKKSVLKQFKKHKNEVETFMNTHSINLNVESDIRKLFAYANNLN